MKSKEINLENNHETLKKEIILMINKCKIYSLWILNDLYVIACLMNY